MSTNSELKTTSNANGTGDERQWRDGGRRPPRSCTKRLYSTGTNGQSRELLFSDSQKKVWSQFSTPPAGLLTRGEWDSHNRRNETPKGRALAAVAPSTFSETRARNMQP